MIIIDIIAHKILKIQYKSTSFIMEGFQFSVCMYAIKDHEYNMIYSQSIIIADWI